MVTGRALAAMWLCASVLAVPVAAGQAPAAPAAASRSGYEADRADILAMAGTYRVRFDMQEATVWEPGYTPLDRKISGGDEVVRVIEDSGRRIVLQHLLVVSHGGQSHVIKHWRQDWEYEPARVLVYAGPGEWRWRDVPAGERRGRWAQTVWQVDDSPRYGGLGRWETVAGLRRWQSDESWRPLARRDAVRKPVYDRYLSINRHQSSPAGWVHWQDNVKMTGAATPVVQEYVLNSYSKFADFDVKAADDYWAATKGYWAKIRDAWDAAAKRHGAIRVREEAETGTVISAKLLELASAIQAGERKEAEAVTEAVGLIEAETARR